jgi:hypothetical protein
MDASKMHSLDMVADPTEAELSWRSGRLDNVCGVCVGRNDPIDTVLPTPPVSTGTLVTCCAPSNSPCARHLRNDRRSRTVRRDMVDDVEAC